MESHWKRHLARCFEAKLSTVDQQAWNAPAAQETGAVRFLWSFRSASSGSCNHRLGIITIYQACSFKQQRKRPQHLCGSPAKVLIPRMCICYKSIAAWCQRNGKDAAHQPRDLQSRGLLVDAFFTFCASTRLAMDRSPAIAECIVLHPWL